MAIAELDAENADLDISSQITVLTDTPHATDNILCMGLLMLGDGAKDLDGSGGLFELTITVGGNTVQPDPQGIWFSVAIRSAVYTSNFAVPAGEEVIFKILSPNGADTDIDVRAYLYNIS